jgi:outer membrane protein TolC
MVRVNLRQKKEDIKRQVRQQLSYFAASRERSLLRAEQIKQAEGKLALAEVKFRHGMADNFSIIETETELQNARIGLLSEEVDSALSVYRLAAITGHLLDGLFKPQAVGPHD